MHHTEYGVRMYSIKTEEGEISGMLNFFRELLHHTEYGGRMSSASTELGKKTGL